MVKKSPQFKEGETVVYPKHGVGEITKIETMEIESIKTNFFIFPTFNKYTLTYGKCYENTLFLNRCLHLIGVKFFDGYIANTQFLYYCSY